MIERMTTIEVNPTPRELASEFCNMVDEDQAEFFNHIARIVDGWDHDFVFQLQSLTDCGKLTEGGRGIMENIGVYAPELSMSKPKG